MCTYVCVWVSVLSLESLFLIQLGQHKVYYHHFKDSVVIVLYVDDEGGVLISGVVLLYVAGTMHGVPIKGGILI